MPHVKLLDPADTRRRLDRYELIGEIAAGGMATVFLARLAGVGGFQRFVAIKRLHPHLAGEQEFIEMFLDEARLAAGIHHPHVVPILEVGTTEAGYYLVMEYIEGDTLARVYARALSSGKTVARPVLVRIILDALAGLHAAHELTDPEGRPVNLVHRDCSPQNILVGVDGCSRITDFGVARATSRLASTRSDRLKGKLAYMAPEQTKGGALDRRADVFAMGIVLWEVLTGRRLFKAESEAATLSRIVLEPIPRVRAVVPDAPRELDEVCARALERDPARRYQSAAEMADALERAALDASSEGVAPPRAVAAFVQGVLGQEIAAQRESVRVWLQHESSAAESKGRPRLDLFANVPGRISSTPPEPKDRPSQERVAPPRPSDAGAGPPGSLDAPDSVTLAARPSRPSDEASARLDGVIAVDLPDEAPPPARETDPAAREASLTTGSMAFAPRPSERPSLVTSPPGRRRGRAVAVGSAVAIAVAGVIVWTALRPAAPDAPDALVQTPAAHAETAGDDRKSAAAAIPPATAEPPATGSPPVAATETASPTVAASASAEQPSPAPQRSPPAAVPLHGAPAGPTTARPAQPERSAPITPPPSSDLANPYR